MRALLASPLGFLIGLALGALGGGGSIIAVPLLVYVAGQDPQAATATSLALVTLTASIGLIPHWRAGHVRLVPGLLFGATGVAGNLLGSQLNHVADPAVLLLTFSVLMLVAAAAMWRSLRRQQADGESVDSGDVRPPPQPSSRTASIDAATVMKVLVAGSLVGLLTGFFGVGGGFVIVPALVLSLGFSMPDAVGTSLLVIVINSLVALSARAGAGNLDWHVAVPFAITSIAGVVTGSRLAATRNPAVLQRAFVWLLVVVATYTATRSLIALS
jgi:uncharacterized protein